VSKPNDPDAKYSLAASPSGVNSNYKKILYKKYKELKHIETLK